MSNTATALAVAERLQTGQAPQGDTRGEWRDVEYARSERGTKLAEEGMKSEARAARSRPQPSAVEYARSERGTKLAERLQ